MKRKTYTKEFKVEAARLVLEHGMKVSEAARDLGICSMSLSKWIKQFKENGLASFPGKGRLLPWDQEKRDLQVRLKRAETERDILKKTIGYLAESR